ncbi:PAS domain S-box protein [Mucilaginibacter sp. L3T2-6]|uniref:PAS domain S-box protein n=1 Tax=Mucilaginibacter sp. L3T2-6 TaxID=3062491 RepID=UPI0026746213|nr:PAS domain S-box protein [Mucilaginibacter sp. L3T2-6]MDO3641386.1 PAS domain S-box protein [Mucilaginibacter sp. L3T2-6]MDV6213853.1 PAS domain S-box protein [Mucilaginibacter sp. L3T2-6]
MTRFDRNLRLGYGFSITILLVISLVSFITLQLLLSSNRAVAHSDQVIEKLEKVLSVMKDAETGQRGFLLTGRSEYLEPYNGAYHEALLLSSELGRLTAGNNRQQAHINLIRKVLDQRLNILQRMVEEKQQGRLIAAEDLDAGKAAMDELRKAIARAEADERLLMNEGNVTFSRYTALVPGFIILAALVAVGIGLYSYRSISADFREKERLRAEIETREQEAVALNEELKSANEEITAANEELTSVNAELLEAREELAASNELLERRVEERTLALKESEEQTQALNEELMATNEELAKNHRRLRELVDELRLADERSAKLVAIVESSDDAIIGKNLDGTVTSWNRGAQQIFGYTEAEIIGRSILTLIPEDLQHEEPVILQQLRNGQKIDHYETIRRTADGKLIYVSLTISPIRDKEGNVVGVSKIARDITDQKRNEERKNDFIGMASHELKTPLTSLTALVQVLQKKLKDSPDPFIPQALNKVRLQTKKMSSLINGFLNISRLESGKLEIIKQSFDLRELINEELDEIRLTVNSHTFTFEPATQVIIEADREKIGSVVSNLLSNAVKYSPRGKLVNVSCTLLNAEVQVSVTDEGMGIRPQDLSRIFDRYYRSESEHTRNISGFGVGLYLSAEIVRRHNGRIWVESEKGKGSTFYFKLPA